MAHTQPKIRASSITMSSRHVPATLEFQRFLVLEELGPKTRAAGGWGRGGAVPAPIFSAPLSESEKPLEPRVRASLRCIRTKRRCKGSDAPQAVGMRQRQLRIQVSTRSHASKGGSLNIDMNLITVSLMCHADSKSSVTRKP